jgi:hypothetical protein
VFRTRFLDDGVEVGNDREIELPKQREQKASNRSSVNGAFMLDGEHIDIRRSQETILMVLLINPGEAVLRAALEMAHAIAYALASSLQKKSRADNGTCSGGTLFFCYIHFSFKIRSFAENTPSPR